MTAELNGAAPATDAPPAPSPPPPDSAELSRLGDRIAAMAASINAAMYQMLVLIAQFDHHRGWQSPGRASCADWLVWRTGVTIGTAREKVRVARALEHLPKTSREMEAGLLSYTKVRALTRVATPENEDVLLEYAQAGSAAKLPPAPPEPFGRLSNGAARFLDWAVPWELEVAVREALDPDGE